MSTQVKTLREAVDTKPGEFINGGFQAVVISGQTRQTKTGKVMYTGKVREGDLTANVTSFTTDFNAFSGKLVKFVGMGISRKDDYNGVAQITIGEKARWIPAGDAPTQAPAQAPQQNATYGAHQGQQPQQSASNGVIPGVTVGMAVNKAVDIINATGGEPSEHNVWELASRLIRVSERLQRGELHTQSANSEQSAVDENVPF